jgi:hypothetical protein
MARPILGEELALKLSVSSLLFTNCVLFHLFYVKIFFLVYCSQIPMICVICEWGIRRKYQFSSVGDRAAATYIACRRMPFICSCMTTPESDPYNSSPVGTSRLTPPVFSHLPNLPTLLSAAFFSGDPYSTSGRLDNTTQLEDVSSAVSR